jgi:glycosyltransferase involved in cell wall biosynthesis
VNQTLDSNITSSRGKKTGAISFESGHAGPAVLQVLPSLVSGGAERGAVDVAAALVAAGGKALVASSGGPLVRELERLKATHIELPMHSKNPFVMRANARRLEDLIRKHGVDIIHARSRAPAWSALMAARRTGARFVTTFHAAYGTRGPFKRRYNSVMARGERIIAISQFIADHARNNYGVDPDRLKVILRGVDLARFDPKQVTANRMIQLVERWRLPDDLPIVMLPARLSRLKGHELLIEALALLGRHDLRCLFVGDLDGHEAYHRHLAHQTTRNDLSEVVQFVGRCDDMPAAYMLADVIVAPSIQPEGFGRVVAEALALGRPVIASDHGGPREIVTAGETGWLVPPGDPAALAEALKAALDMDQVAREAFARRASEYVRRNFTKERMCAETLAVYYEVMLDGAGREPVMA